MKTTKVFTIARFFITELEFKIARELRNRGYIVNCISFYRTSNTYSRVFNNEYYVIDETFKNRVNIREKLIPKLLKDTKTYSNLAKLILQMRKIKSTIFIGVGEPNLFPVFIGVMLGKRISKYIYLPYDITYLRYNNIKENAIYNWYPEGYLFRRADVILHKGSSKELELLPYNIEDKTKLQFLLSCGNIYKKEKRKRRDHPQVVYVGIIPYDSKGYYEYTDDFRFIINQKIQLHVYPTNYDQVMENIDMDILKSKYFTLHKPIYGEQFQRTLSRYDYGLVLGKYNLDVLNHKLPLTTMANRLATYLEAGLPVIVNDEPVFIRDTIIDNKCGLQLTPDLSSTLKQANYTELLTNVEKTRSEYSIKNNVNKLLKILNM